MKTKVNFNDISVRMDQLRERFENTIQPDPCRKEYDQIVKSSTEDDLYLIFLETHFHSKESAERFHKLMSWKKLLTIKEPELEQVCKSFFKQSKISIGGHRKYFGCLNSQKKIKYTVEILCSYRKVVKEDGSQKKFFEIDGKPEFDKIYEKMRKIKHFNTRLPRFDHLEKLSRANNFYCIPRRFYVEDATGPLDGLTYLIIGERFRGNKTRLKEAILSSAFLQDWNAMVKAPSEYSISKGESLNSILQKLEAWTIVKVEKRLSKDKQGNPAFVFDLETNICNWQKRKKTVM